MDPKNQTADQLIAQIKNKLPHDVLPIIGRFVRPYAPKRCAWCMVQVADSSPHVRSLGKAYLCGKICMINYRKLGEDSF